MASTSSANGLVESNSIQPLPELVEGKAIQLLPELVEGNSEELASTSSANGLVESHSIQPLPELVEGKAIQPLPELVEGNSNNLLTATRCLSLSKATPIIHSPRRTDMQHVLIPPTSNVEQELRQTHLFAGINDEQLALIKQTMRQLLLQPGESLFEHGQPAQRFFLLREGHMKLIRISLEGIEKVFEIVSPGETFAEAVMFMPAATYPVTAVALMPSTLLSFENKVFIEILQESPATCFRLMSQMSRRIRLWLNEIDQLTLQNATYRLINYLLYHLPVGHPNTCQLQFHLPKQVIASRLSIKPETLSRILNCLNHQGLITVEGKTIHIHDVTKLQLYNPQEKCLY